MPTKKHIRPGDKVPLKLTAAERTLVLGGLLCLDKKHEQVIRETPSGKPVMMSLDDLDDFGGYIAAEANHCEDVKQRKKLDAIFEKIEKLLDNYTDEEPPQTITIEDAAKAKVISDQAVQIATWAAQAMIAAEQLGIKKQPLEHFQLAPAQGEVLLLVPGISKTIKNKLAKESAVTVAEVASMIMALAEDLTEGDARKQLAVLFVAKHLMDQLQERIVGPVAPVPSKRPKAKKAATGTLFQFKITLVGSEPPIWRRIQIQDCTLAKFHDIIQVVMGWENCHMHQFIIDGDRYSTPLPDDFDLNFKDERKMRLSQIVSKAGTKARFKYEYDFGDGWLHEVVFEGLVKPEAKAKYPRCVAGTRSGPPEDIGGIWGYEEYLEAIGDPKHERHEEFMEWNGGWDAEKFAVEEINKTLHGVSPR